MLEARSVAVVGASAREGSLGNRMVLELVRAGFDGPIYPVNPRYDEVLGHRCYASIGDVPEPVDLAILGLANEHIEAALIAAIDAGAGSAATFSSLYEDAPPAPGLPPLKERMATLARQAGMAFCGGNGMGFLNLEANVRAVGFATPDRLRRGSVTFISHSGSGFDSLMYSHRGIGFNLLVSAGQELVTDVADYVEYALGLSSTLVIGLMLETVRRPDAFRQALAHAAERDVAVVALKIGRTEGSKSMVTAHSGALAGEDGAYEALFDAYGVHRVTTLDEMVDVLELFSSPRRVTGGSGIASLHDSGGERVLFVDLASDLGVPLAQISEETTSKLQTALDPGMVAANPLDAWGTGIDSDRILTECLHALHDDPATAALAFVVDLSPQGEPYDEGYLQIARDLFASTTKPFCMMSNLSSAIAREEVAILRDAGIPVLEGTATGLLALRHLLAARDARGRDSVVPPTPVPHAVRERWRSRLAAGDVVSELEGLSLLADYGLSTIEAHEAGSADDASKLAATIGWPVALKTAMPGVSHKSDVGGVALGIADEAALRAAYLDMEERLGPRMVVEAMAPAGVEMALGIVSDPQFGPLVLVAAGGILVEVLHDRRLAFPPLDDARARTLIDGLRIRPLLDGVRGTPPADVGALAHAVSRLSLLAEDLGDLVEAIDVNPVIVSTPGCVAVGALVVPRAGV